jgi:hypothetical protein
MVKKVNEEFKSDDGSSTAPEPVATGDIHANRPQDASALPPQGPEQLNPEVTRVNMISGIMTALAAASTSELQGVYQTIVDPANANKSTTGNAANYASIKSSVNEAFGGIEGLSEEFMDKAATLVESTVNIILTEQVAALDEEYDNKLTEAYELFTEEATANLDRYLAYVVESWMKDNEIAVESGIKVQIAESILTGVRALAESHDMDFDAASIEADTAAADAKVDALEEELRESERRNVALNEQVKKFARDGIIAEAVKGLAMNQADKVRQLAETVEFSTPEEFKAKLNTLKEASVTKVTTATTGVLNESFDSSTPEAPKVDPKMASYLAAIKRSEF